MDWARFRFDWRLEKDFMGDLIQIEASREAALHLVLPRDWSRELDELNRIRAIHGTTALEGNPLSEEAVRERLRGAPDSSGEESREERQVRNAGRAQNWVRARFGPDSRRLQVSDILEMHRLLTEGSDEENSVPGKLRQHAVVVGTEALGGVHRGAPHAELSRRMAEFVAFVHSRRMNEQHAVVRAVVAHFFLLTIHPFGDGNGRVSRLVEAGILFRGGYNVHGFYGLSNYFYRNGDAYRSLLQRSRRSQPFDLTEFVAFGIRGFRAELRGINSFIKTRLNRVMYRQAMDRAHQARISPRRRTLNEREIGLLEFLIRATEPADPFSKEPSRRVGLSSLLADPYVRTVYRNVTERTFRRELVRLFELGFIRLTGDAPQWDVEPDFGAIGRY